MTRIFLYPMLGFVAANFIYQAFGAGLWGVAVERSILQVLTLGSTWFIALLAPRAPPHLKAKGCR